MLMMWLHDYIILLEQETEADRSDCDQMNLFKISIYITTLGTA